jgi:hypothetical protein
MINSRSNRKPRWATVLVAALVFLFCTAGALLAITGALRFSTVKAIVDQRASDGHAEGFTEPLFTAIAGRAQKASVAFLAYGVPI